MQNILITGASGFIAQALINLLYLKGNTIHTLSRKPIDDKRIKSFIWNVENQEIDLKAFDNIDTIIHLAGENIGDKAWTHERKKALVDSRVNSTKLIVNSLQLLHKIVDNYIGASATGYYGNSGDELVDETSHPGTNFLATTCIEWEQAHLSMKPLCNHYYILRFPVVLDLNNGALPKMLMTFPFAINYFGNGKQYMPWIHIEDLCNMIVYLLENNIKSGIYNAHHPQIINNKDFTKLLAKYKVPYTPIMPVPSFILKTILGESASLVLDGQRSNSEKIVATGFIFTNKTLDQAFKKIFN